MFRLTATSGFLPKLKLGALAVAMLAGSASIAAADLLDEVKARGEIVLGTEMQFAPFDMLVNGEYQGINRDLMDEVAKDLGVKAKYIDLPWSSVLPGLEAGKYDMVNAPVTITDERRKRFAFTVPIADATVALLKRADDKEINSPADIAGHPVGGGKGSAQLAQLKAFAETLDKDVEIKEYVDNNQAYADLAAGRIDAVANSFPNLGYVAKQRPEMFAVVVPPFGEPRYFGWVARLDDESRSLVEAVNAILIKMQDDGRLAAIHEKWLGVAVELPREVPAGQ
jgi:polar amino acid transport system substrate-binding protein